MNNESSKPYERTLTGVVKEVSGETIPGATVQVKGHTNIVCVSDMYGNFVLKNIPSGKQTIVISFLGMESQEIAYTGQKSITVTMVEKANEIKDVVVTGIYVRKKSSFTGSASTYTKDELKKIGTKNLIQSLKTLEPSLNVVENSSWGSDPNRMPDMEIRGKTSIVGSLESDYDNTGNQPLFIMDGVEVTIQDIMKLPMDRIANVTVLKDAASSAIYGSKAANGVIVVETVRPESGKLRVSYSGNFAVQMPDLTDYNLMNASEKLEYERLAGRYTAKDAYTSQDALDALYYSRLREVKRGVNTYWLSEPLRAVLNHSHNMYIDGGDDSMVYGVGLSYSNDDGVMKGSDRSTVSGNIKLTYRTKSLIFSNDFNIDITNSDHEPVEFSTFAQANPYYLKYNDDGSIPTLLESTDVAGNTIYNPLYLYNIVNKNHTNEMTLRNNFSLIWRFWNAFQLRGRLGLSKSVSKNETFKSPKHPDFLSATLKGSYGSENDDNFAYNGETTITFGNVFNDAHPVNLVGGWYFSEKTVNRNAYMVYGFTSDLHQNPQFSAGFTEGDKPTYNKTISRSTSFYFNGNYSYKNRYLFDANLRW
ncbi:MAG: TonB-dependent receptor plug domain-containing protein, partial [Prevotella sp.]|nr:TonB-dependent receptor plug domain-containing protein [Prevotella sp.]